MQPSLSQTTVRGTAPICSKHFVMPPSTSWAALVGTIQAAMNLENPHTDVTTQRFASWPKPSGILVAGCHRSNCASSPGS